MPSAVPRLRLPALVSLPRPRTVAALLAAITFAFAAAPGRAPALQGLTLIPNEMHNSLTFELHSVKDQVELYEGDPQVLFRLEIHPRFSLPPKIEFSNTNKVATLRVRDLSLFELPPEPADQGGEDAEFEEESRPERAPESQGWVLQLAPAGPTDFVLECDGGKGDFDFTDLPVHSVHLLADTTVVRVEFKRPNLVPLERFKLTVRAGGAILREFLNARSKSATLQLGESKCELELTGEPFDGEGDVFVEGVPVALTVVVSRAVGLRVEGPVSAVARFDREGMVRQDLALESPGFAANRCRLRLHFSQAVPALKVQWRD